MGKLAATSSRAVEFGGNVRPRKTIVHRYLHGKEDDEAVSLNEGMFYHPNNGRQMDPE